MTQMYDIMEKTINFIDNMNALILNEVLQKNKSTILEF